MNKLSSMPSDSRLWVFVSKAVLSPDAQAMLEAGLSDYTAAWTAHKKPVRGGFAVLAERIILVAAEKGFEEVSGCSIDTLFAAVSSLLSSLGTELVDPADIVFESQGKVLVSDRAGFRELVAEGAVNESTIVYDPTIQTLADFQLGKLAVPAKDCWHKRLFFSS